jgi:hypothetical protein
MCFLLNFRPEYFIKSKLVLSLNHMRTLSILFSVVIISALAASCVRENEFVAPKPDVVGGKSDSGTNTLRVTPRHHLDQNIDSAIVHITYDATGYYKPSDSKPVKMVDGKPMAIFDSLMPGNYYLYATGRDRTLDTPVQGGATFRILPRESKEKRTYDLYLDVTEDAPHNN